jgi:hypothetical protein
MKTRAAVTWGLDQGYAAAGAGGNSGVVAGFF